VQLARLDEQIARGEGDPLTLGRERVELREALAASKKKAAAQKAVAHARAVAERDADLRAEIDDGMTKVAGHIAGLLWELPRIEQLIGRAHAGGLTGGGLIEDVFGVPPDFPAKLLQAIHDAAPRADWHITSAIDGSAPVRPTLRKEATVYLDGGYGRPPHNFTGTWPPDENE
jgi:hypothetical protein